MNEPKEEIPQTLRPKIRLLSRPLIERIVDEAFDVLEKVGIRMNSQEGLDLLGDHGARIDKVKQQACISRQMVNTALNSAPSSIKLYDRSGALAANLEGNAVHFLPLSGGTHVWDAAIEKIRPALAQDVKDCICVTDAMNHIALQSSNYYPNDIHPEIRSYYRNFLVLKYGKKPNWGSVAATRENVHVMLALMTAVRGSEQGLKEKPLMLFPATPISPLQWDDPCFYLLKEFTLKGVPLSIIPAPTMGGTAPVALIGGVVQSVAESLSGVVMNQLLSPGAPVIMGPFPFAMDMRYGTSCASAMETFMAIMACVEVAKHLNLPSQSMAGFCDAKRHDTQSGFETGIGQVLSALGGANIIEGAGGLGSCMNGSLEQLVIADEVAGMVFRLLKGISARGERLAEDLFAESLFSGDHFLTSPVTMQWFKKEIRYPGKIVSREMVADWQADGCRTAEDRAQEEVERILNTHESEPLDPVIEKELADIVMGHAKKHGVSELPFMGGV